MQVRSLLLTVLAVSVVAAAPAHAQTTNWPTKPITLIVPFPPGGGTDAFARPLAAQLSKQLGRQVIIDNRGGAGGTVGASIAAKAAPDGYTFFVGAVHHAIAPSFYPKARLRHREGPDPADDDCQSAASHRHQRQSRAGGQPEAAAGSAAQERPASSITARRATAPRTTSPANSSSSSRRPTWCISRIAVPARRCRTWSPATST